MESKLAQCPFCGGDAGIEQSGTIWHIYCTENGSHGHYINTYKTREESVTAWNERAARLVELSSDEV